MEEASVTTLLLELAESSGTWKAVVVGGLVLVCDRDWETIANTYVYIKIPGKFVYT